MDGFEVIETLQKVCPIELEIKDSTNTATKLHEKWLDYGDWKRFFRRTESDTLISQFGIRKTHANQCAHHAAVLDCINCLHVVGSFRSFVYVVLF